MTTFQQEQAGLDLDFHPAFTMAQAYEVEARCQEWGVTRRITTCLATKSRDELTHALAQINVSGEGDEIIELIESVQGLIDHHGSMGELYRSVHARLFISAHDALGLALSDTEPQMLQPAGLTCEMHE